MFKQKYYFISFLLILLNFSTAQASLESDSNIIFNWAELQFPQYFSPAGQQTQQPDGWYYRFYPVSNTYIATNNNNQVYILGDVFGAAPIMVGSVSDFVTFINGSSRILNKGNGNCVAAVLTPVGTVMVRENLPVEPIDLSVNLASIPDDILAQLDTEQQALLMAEMAEVNASLEANQLDQIETPTWRNTETVLESSFTRYKSEINGVSESQIGGNTIKGSSHHIGTAYFEILNGISYVIKSKLTGEDTLNVAPKHSSSDLEWTYSPYYFGGPAYEWCEKQSWYSAVVKMHQTGSQIIDGVNSNADISFDTGGGTFIVEAVNETLTVPAGTFNTARLRSTSDYNVQSDSYSITWVGLEHGVEIKSENYTDGKLTSGSHLTSLSL